MMYVSNEINHDLELQRSKRRSSELEKIDILYRMSFDDPTIRLMFDAYRGGKISTVEEMLIMLATQLAAEKQAFIKSLRAAISPADLSFDFKARCSLNGTNASNNIDNT